MHLPFIAHWHSCMPNVCDNNGVWGSNVGFVLLVDSPDKCTGWWHCVSTPKDELPDPRGSLANDIPSCAIK